MASLETEEGYFDVLLLGKVGRGKSTTGNKLLGLDESCFDLLRGDVDTVISIPDKNIRVKIWRLGETPWIEEDDVVVVGRTEGYFPPDEEEAVEMKTRVCKLLSNEETQVRVLDCPGFGSTDKPTEDAELMDANLQVMDSVIRQQKRHELKFSRVLYFLPQRGALEKADGELQEEMKAMSLIFGLKIFDSMVVIATLSPRQSMRGMKFEEDDIQFTQKVFTEALKKVLGEENPSCPPVVYISLKDSPDEVRETVQIAKVNSEAPLLPIEFHDETCIKCDLGVVEINGQRVMVKYDSGCLTKYKSSKCHPTFVPKYTWCQRFLGGLAHIVSLGCILFFLDLLFKIGSWPGFTNSDMVCPVCLEPPRSPGCRPVLQNCGFKALGSSRQQHVYIDHSLKEANE